MATATAPPLESATTKPDKKDKEPKASFSDRWLNKGGWVRRVPLLRALVFTIILTQIPFLATVVISFMNWQANYPNEIAFGGPHNYVTVFNPAGVRSSVF